MSIKTICEEFTLERMRQDAQWGGEAHDDEHFRTDWLHYIQHQLNKALVEESRDAFMGRMVKVGALAIAAIQSQLRKRDGADVEERSK